MSSIEGRCQTCRFREEDDDLPAGIGACTRLGAIPPADVATRRDVAWIDADRGAWAELLVAPEFGCVHWEVRSVAFVGEVTS